MYIQNVFLFLFKPEGNKMLSAELYFYLSVNEMHTLFCVQNDKKKNCLVIKRGKNAAKNTKLETAVFANFKGHNGCFFFNKKAK